jgi:hypothetical protein
LNARRSDCEESVKAEKILDARNAGRLKQPVSASR